MALGTKELAAIGLVDPSDVEAGYVVRMPKAYPVYDDVYSDNVEVIRRWFEEHAPNVHPVGRNGMHKYNNQDHSMYTAMLTVENIHGADHDIWSVNVEEEYHETSDGRSGAGASASTGRDTPVLPRPRGLSGGGRSVGRDESDAPTGAEDAEPGLDLILEEVETMVDPIGESAAGPGDGDHGGRRPDDLAAPRRVGAQSGRLRQLDEGWPAQAGPVAIAGMLVNGAAALVVMAVARLVSSRPTARSPSSSASSSSCPCPDRPSWSVWCAGSPASR